MAGIEQTLRTLRDVQGVYGSFVFAANGGLVARDLPEVFDPELLAEVGPRITRLYETFMSGGDEIDACVIRYSDYKLYLRAMTWGTIGVLSGVGINMPALRMVTNLVIRKIDPEVQSSPRANSTRMDPSYSSAPPEPQPTRAGSHGPAASMPPPERPSDPPERAFHPPERTSYPPPERASHPPPEQTPSPPPENPPAEGNGMEPASRKVRMYRGRPVLDE